MNSSHESSKPKQNQDIQMGGNVNLSRKKNIIKLIKHPEHTEIGYYYFRSLCPQDRKIVQILHEEWFPVKYTNEFYDALVHNQLAGTNESLYSSVAVQVKFWNQNINSTNEVNGRCEKKATNRNYKNITNTNNLYAASIYSHNENSINDCYDHSSLENVQRSPLISTSTNSKLPPSNYDINDIEKGSSNSQRCVYNKSTSYYNSKKENQIEIDQSSIHQMSTSSSQNERILGCLVGSYVRSTQTPHEIRACLIRNPEIHPLMFYIMTLGTTSDVRKLGLGTDLVLKCIDFIKQEKKCGVVYLHVITYNVAAIRFYEKLGFRKMKEIEGMFSQLFFFPKTN